MGQLEDESIVTEGRGLGSSYALLQAYDGLIREPTESSSITSSS